MVSATGRGSVSESALQGAINKIWSALKVEGGGMSFEFSKRLMSRNSYFSGFVYNNVNTALQSLWLRLLSKMSMEDEHGAIIPESTTKFAEAFGWTREIDEVFNPAVKVPTHRGDKTEFDAKRWIVIEDLAQAGLDARHAAAHHYTPAQVKAQAEDPLVRSGPITRHRPQQTALGMMRAAPFARRPYPIDIFFAYAIFGAFIAGKP